jgi:hypothetical protein
MFFVRYASEPICNPALVDQWLAVVAQWIEVPTAENAQHCEAALIEIGVIPQKDLDWALDVVRTPPESGVIRDWFGLKATHYFSLMVVSFLEVIQLQGFLPDRLFMAATQAQLLVSMVANVRPDTAIPRQNRAFRQTAEHWQLEAAWAILQGQEPPPIELPE